MYQFHLSLPNRQGILRLLVAFLCPWLLFLTTQSSSTRPGDWLELFSTLDAAFPQLFFSLPYTRTPVVTSTISSHSLDASLSCYKVLLSSWLLKRAHQLNSKYIGVLKWVQVVHISLGSNKKKPPFLLFSGRLDSLHFDAGRWAWSDHSLLHSFTTWKGIYLLNPWNVLKRPINVNWQGLLPASFFPKWREVWQPQCSRKKVAYIRSILHGAIAVNTWLAKASPHTDPTCTCYGMALPESLLHRFYLCLLFAYAWKYAMAILYYYLRVSTDVVGCWPNFTW
jgi:hypothetical protein